MRVKSKQKYLFIQNRQRKVVTDFFVHKKPRNSIHKNNMNISGIVAMKKKSILFNNKPKSIISEIGKLGFNLFLIC